MAIVEIRNRLFLVDGFKWQFCYISLLELNMRDPNGLKCSFTFENPFNRCSNEPSIYLMDIVVLCSEAGHTVNVRLGT